MSVLLDFLEILKSWWWLFLPFILFSPFKALFLFYTRQSAAKKLKSIVLEIKIPKEVLKPLRGMEHIFSALWSVYDWPDWKEKWFEGKVPTSISFEIASIGGEPRFFIRIPDHLQNIVESSIYSQFSNVEISIVDDYTKYIPQDIPNKDWDIWGSDFCLFNDDIYPIKTYSKFFEEKETSKDEKRVDPLSPFLEGMTNLQMGEQLWVQFVVTPISKKENDYIDRGNILIDKLAKRPSKAKSKPIIQEAVETLLTGVPLGGGETEAKASSEMKLTAGEKDVIAEVERKISRYAFETSVRCVYLAKRDVFFKPQIKTIFGFLASLSAPNLNGFKPWKKTAIKEGMIFKSRKLYLKKRDMFRNYIQRTPPKGSAFILNTEEMATLYHFPGILAAPAPFISRIESKKGEPPIGLPTE